MSTGEDRASDPDAKEDKPNAETCDSDGCYLVHEGELSDEDENYDSPDACDPNRWDIDYPEESSSDEDETREQSGSDEEENKEDEEANPIHPRVKSMEHEDAYDHVEQSRKQAHKETEGKAGAGLPCRSPPNLLDIGGANAPGVRSSDKFAKFMPTALNTNKGFVEPYPGIKFANLEGLATELSRVLQQPNQPSEIRHCDYPGAIRAYGGAEKLVKDALSCVDPDILLLQSDYLSPERHARLKAVHGLHDRWPRQSGYLVFVTDDRNDKYLRFYVGQSGNAIDRLSGHLISITRGDCHTLQYYILQLGTGHRRANFLRLWAIPDGMASGPSKEIAQIRFILLQNFFEMLFCAAFHSLPKKTLEPFFGVSPYGRNLDIGLNILSPLLQQQDASILSRSHYRNRVSSSPDFEIQSWSDVRNKQLALDQSKRKVKSTQLRSSTSKETLLASLEALHKPSNSSNPGKSFTDSLHLPNSPATMFDLETELSLRFPEDSLCIRPKGNVQSSVAIVLDNMAFSAETSNASMPSILESIGLYEGNCMTWTYNHTAFGILDTANLNSHNMATSENFSRRHHELSCNGFTEFLLDTCNFRVVLLCGALSELHVRSALELGEPGIVQLRGEDVQVWKRQHLNGWQFIFCTPEPFAVGLRQMSEQIIILGEICKATGTLSGLQLDFHFFERKNAYSLVFQQMALEKADRNASTQMTAHKLDQGVRNFLYRKGFEVIEDLINLEAIAGSLARGICMLGLFCFPRKSAESSQVSRRAPMGPRRPSSKEGRVPFSEEQKMAVRDLYAQVMRKKDNKCLTRSLGKPLPKSEVTAALRLGSSHLHNVSTQNSVEEEFEDALDPGLFDDPGPEPELPRIAANATAYLQEHDEIDWCESRGLDTASSIQAYGQMEVAILSSKELIKKISGRALKTQGSNSIIPMKRKTSDEDAQIRRFPRTTLQTSRNASENPYLRTLISGHNAVRIQCAKCSTLLGEDPSPSYTTLPPFRGLYIAIETSCCPTEDCHLQQSAIPVDPKVGYVLYNDFHNMRRKGKSKYYSLYEKLDLIFCKGDTSVVLSPEELNMPNHDFSRRKRRKLT